MGIHYSVKFDYKKISRDHIIMKFKGDYSKFNKVHLLICLKNFQFDPLKHVFRVDC